jgi:hypothetical protein
MGPGEVADFCSGAPLNTDDNGLVEFSAPLHLYDGQCYFSNMIEIRRFQADPADYVGGDHLPALGRLLLTAAGDLRSYWGSDFADGLKGEAEGL